MRLQTSLSPRQLLLCGLGLLACLLAFFWIAQNDRSDTAERRLRTASRQLQQLHMERETFAVIQAARTAQTAVQTTGNKKGGLMYSLLEQAIAKAGLTPHLQYLRPDSKTEDELYVSEKLSVAMRQLDRAQIVTFLHATEVSIPGLEVESFNVIKTREGFANVEAVFTARLAK